MAGSELYFAYGNNMAESTMRGRIGEGHHLFLGVARLDGFRLTFTTETPEWGGPVADLTEEEGSAVYGVLYEVDQVAWKRLAPHEPTYIHRRVPVRLLVPSALSSHEAGDVLEVTIYFVPDEDKLPEQAAEPRYLARIMAAAIERGLPATHLDAIRFAGA
ncbi:MAG: gamma-glutamylcyclotransferase family protein [Planctomycetota bacterium]